MNPTLVKNALAIVLDANVLVNLVSRRVRQLSAGGGSSSLPLLGDVGHLPAADIALSEIIEGKMGWDLPEVARLTRPSGKGRRRPQHWGRLQGEE